MPAADVVRAAQLGAYAYTTLPDDDPARPQFRADYLSALTRHHAIRRELVPLLAAWHRAAIEVLLFKGFYMAQFVYPVPGSRFHGDVDLALPRGREKEASVIARARGWTEHANSADAGRPYLHCAFNLDRRDGATRIDAHRYLVHSRLPWPRLQPRVTAAVWNRSLETQLDGVPCRIPDPTDALLVLALQRCWGDGWRLKMHDAIDMRHLTERFDVDRRALLDRARALGCARTVRIFLDMCDPENGRVRLDAPARGTVRRHQISVLPERPLLAVERPLMYARLAPGVLYDAARSTPLVLRTVRLARRHRDIDALLSAATPRTQRKMPPRRDEQRRIVRGIRWSVRLLRIDSGGSCLVRSLAIYTALRNRGWPAVFVSGVRRTDEGALLGHAWVELDGEVLPELNEPDNRRLFRVNIER